MKSRFGSALTVTKCRFNQLQGSRRVPLYVVLLWGEVERKGRQSNCSGVPSNSVRCNRLATIGIIIRKPISRIVFIRRILLELPWRWVSIVVCLQRNSFASIVGNHFNVIPGSTSRIPIAEIKIGPDSLCFVLADFAQKLVLCVTISSQLI